MPYSACPPVPFLTAQTVFCLLCVTPQLLVFSFVSLSLFTFTCSQYPFFLPKYYLTLKMGYSCHNLNIWSCTHMYTAIEISSHQKLFSAHVLFARNLGLLSIDLWSLTSLQLDGAITRVHTVMFCVDIPLGESEMASYKNCVPNINTPCKWI